MLNSNAKRPMKFVKYLFTVALVVVVSMNSFSQKDFSKEADNAFEAELYAEAIDLYKKAFAAAKRDRIEQARIIFQMAKCYRENNKYKHAELWFDKSIKAKHLDPLSYLYLADAKKQNGKYEEALSWYQRYSKKLPNDQRGKDGIASCQLAMEWMDAKSRYVVEINNAFNTEYDDFSPTYADKYYRKVYFTSARPGGAGPNTDGTTGQGFTDLFQASQDRKGRWSAPIITEGGVNSQYNEGASAFNKRFNTIYFTKCIIQKDANMGCQIYWSQRKGKGWGDAQEIKIAHDSISVLHPAIADDDVTMYFSSNMEGTLGGKDIWVTVLDKQTRTWSAPKNLGPEFNTVGDEKFPFIRKNGDLYYSSNGLLGMGGLDIFVAESNGDGTFAAPKNMKYPINTSADDFGITFQGDKEAGLFSSNRYGGKGGDDIYEFNVPPLIIFLDGYVRDVDTKEIIPYAVVELRGSDGSVQIDTTGSDAYYKFPLSEETSYDIEGRKKGYLSDYAHVTSVGVKVSSTLKSDKDLELINIDVPIELPNINYDLAKWDLRPEAKESLLDLVETLNLHPEITIELRSHTDYRASDKYNKTLSQKRAKSCVDFLVEKGIARDRLSPKGYGESSPRRVNKTVASKTPYNEGDLLTEKFLGPVSHKGEDKWEIGMELNRRTEFFILRTDYVPKTGATSTEQ